METEGSIHTGRKRRLRLILGLAGTVPLNLVAVFVPRLAIAEVERVKLVCVSVGREVEN